MPPYEARRETSARHVTTENYSGIGSFFDTEATSPAQCKIYWATTHAALTVIRQALLGTTPRRVVNNMENDVFNDLPLLLAVPRAARLLGISRAAAYRLVASGELPVRRLGGRVYVLTAGLRELAS